MQGSGLASRRKPARRVLGDEVFQAMFLQILEDGLLALLPGVQGAGDAGTAGAVLHDATCNLEGAFCRFDGVSERDLSPAARGGSLRRGPVRSGSGRHGRGWPGCGQAGDAGHALRRRSGRRSPALRARQGRPMRAARNVPRCSTPTSLLTALSVGSGSPGTGAWTAGCCRPSGSLATPEPCSAAAQRANAPG